MLVCYYAVASPDQNNHLNSAYTHWLRSAQPKRSLTSYNIKFILWSCSLNALQRMIRIARKAGTSKSVIHFINCVGKWSIFCTTQWNRFKYLALHHISMNEWYSRITDTRDLNDTLFVRWFSAGRCQKSTGSAPSSLSGNRYHIVQMCHYCTWSINQCCILKLSGLND